MNRGFNKIKNDAVHIDGSALVRIDWDESEGLLSFVRWAIDEKFIKFIKPREIDAAHILVERIFESSESQNKK